MELQSINEIFTNRILRIPSYQRGYSWSNNKLVDTEAKEPFKDINGQLKDLWDDLMNIPEHGWHYTGLLTLVEVKDLTYPWLKTHKEFSVVDGQQRITSILILLSVIIDRAKKHGVVLGIREDDAEIQYLKINKSDALTAFIFGYEEDNPSDKFFKKHILNIQDIEDDSLESVYTENLLKAKNFFDKAVDLHLRSQMIAVEEAIEELFNKVTVGLRLNEYILPGELDEYVVFETMNNRGKPLSELEKLKNRLMYLNDKFSLETEAKSDNREELLLAQKRQLSEDINQAWITIYQSLGRKKSEPLNDEDFVKNHWIMYFDDYSREESHVYSNFLFNEYFTLQKLYSSDLKVKHLKRYVLSLQKSSKWWLKLNHPEFFEEHELSLKNAIHGLHRVGFRVPFKPLVLAILLREDRNEFIGTIKMIELYSFKIFDISSRRSNTGDSKFYALAYKVAYQHISVEETNEAIELYTQEYFRFTSFQNHIREQFETNKGLGFYQWSGIRYFLYEYDLYLRDQNQVSTRASEINWHDFKKKNSIEHIFPQSAVPGIIEYAQSKGKIAEQVAVEYLKVQNNWPDFKDYTPEERGRLAHSLGNLLAISQKDNSSFKNDPWKFKVDQATKGESYARRGFKYDSMSAQVIAAQNPDWSPEAILERGLEMLNFLCTYIGESFELLSEETKYNILGLEFY